MDAVQAVRIYGVNEVLSHFTDVMRQNPRMVKAMAETSLSFRHGDVKLAVKSLNSYLDWRLKKFGHLNDQCLASDRKLQEQLASKFIQICPKRLGNGEALVYVSMKNHDPSLYSTEDTIKCMHFLLISSIIEDPSLAEKGFVLVNNMVDVEWRHLDMNFPGAIASAVGRSIPIRLTTLVIVDPPLLIRFIVPIVKSVLPARLSDRLHIVTDLSQLTGVVHVNDVVDLPEELGGKVILTIDADLERFVAENRCA